MGSPANSYPGGVHFAGIRLCWICADTNGGEKGEYLSRWKIHGRGEPPLRCGKTILTQYAKNKAALEAKIVARMTTKALAQVGAKMAAKEALKNVPFAALFANIAVDMAAETWLANEEADLRSWQSLPKEIKYLRIDDITPGEHTVKIDFGCGVETKRLIIEKDRCNVIYITYAK